MTWAPRSEQPPAQPPRLLWGRWPWRAGPTDSRLAQRPASPGAECHLRSARGTDGAEQLCLPLSVLSLDIQIIVTSRDMVLSPVAVTDVDWPGHIPCPLCLVPLSRRVREDPPPRAGLGATQCPPSDRARRAAWPQTCDTESKIPEQSLLAAHSARSLAKFLFSI